MMRNTSQVAVQNPWTGDIETADYCWACGEVFDKGADAVVVDAAFPKVVHERAVCRNKLDSPTERTKRIKRIKERLATRARALPPLEPSGE